MATRWLRNEHTGEFARVEIDAATQQRNDQVKDAVQWLETRRRTFQEIALILASYVLDRARSKHTVPIDFGELVDKAEEYLHNFAAMPHSAHELAALAVSFANTFTIDSDGKLCAMHANRPDRPVSVPNVGEFFVHDELGPCVRTPQRQ